MLNCPRDELSERLKEQEEVPTDVAGGEEGIRSEDEAPEEVDELALLRNHLEDKTRESEENYERFLRARADLDNMRKRFQKEKEEILRFAARPLVEKLLPVIDDFTRAREAAQNSRDFDGLLQGVEMIEKKLFELLQAEGVTVIEALHKPFDPRFHESLMVEETPDFPDNTVIEEFQKGYLMADRLIRPSLVKVSKQPTDKGQ